VGRFIVRRDARNLNQIGGTYLERTGEDVWPAAEQGSPILLGSGRSFRPPTVSAQPLDCRPAPWSAALPLAAARRVDRGLTTGGNRWAIVENRRHVEHFLDTLQRDLSSGLVSGLTTSSNRGRPAAASS